MRRAGAGLLFAKAQLKVSRMKKSQETPAPSPKTESRASGGSDDALAPRVWEALAGVIDPELHYNIVDLGLVYGVEVKEAVATVTLTLTSPACPYGPYLLHEVRMAAEAVPGMKKAKLDVVWDPPWEPALMSEEARLDLGFDL